jgi:aspartate-semialdehyde dehydrogenase
MTMRNLRIGLVGATGAVGGSVIEALERSTQALWELVPIASPDTGAHTIAFRGEERLIHNATDEVLRSCDLVILACPAAVAEKLSSLILDEGIACFDLSGVLAEHAGSPILPLVNSEALEAFRERRIAVFPRPLSATISTVLAPVVRAFGPCIVRGTALLPVSVAGRSGTDELAQEVISLFSQKEPPHEIFPEGLAFDLDPRMLTGLSGGQSFEERATSAQTAALLGLPLSAVYVTCVLSPQFSALAASLHVMGDLRAEGVRECWKAAPGVVLVDDEDTRLRPRAVGGVPAVHIGRLRDDPAGHGVHLWLTADALAFGVSANVAAVLGGLIAQDLI